MDRQTFATGLFLLLAASAWNAGLAVAAAVFATCILVICFRHPVAQISGHPVRRRHVIAALVAVLAIWYGLLPPLLERI